MKIFTIGFTGKTAQEFFGKLQSSGAAYLLDTRLNNTSQLAGFTKKGSIEYFTRRLTDLTYVEAPLLAPEDEMLKQYRNDNDWPTYEASYLELIRQRNVAEELDEGLFRGGAVLLCSERTADQCHRRLAAEFMKSTRYSDAEIVHL